DRRECAEPLPVLEPAEYAQRAARPVVPHRLDLEAVGGPRRALDLEDIRRRQQALEGLVALTAIREELLRQHRLRFLGVHLARSPAGYLPRGAPCSSSARLAFQNLAWPVVPCPAVWSLAGISSTRPFGTRLISRSSSPSSGGLRSSSAELMARRVALMRSRPGEAL